MISLGEGRQKLKFSLALPSLRDSRWYTAGYPSLQKLRVWEIWCWTKHWAVGVHSAILGIGGRGSRSCGPSSCVCGKPPLESPGARG